MKKEENETESLKKEEIAEDWCFQCKDGGLLMVCEYKHCLKSYHPDCVEKDESYLEAGNHWTCDLHICFICRKSSDVRCLSCPTAVCWHCMNDEQFVQIREDKGLCSKCLKLALMIEEKLDFDSDGSYVDFNDIETEEGLYKEYWEIINKKEGLTLETLCSADARMKKGKINKKGKKEKKSNKKKSQKEYSAELEERDGSVDYVVISDSDCSNDTVKRKSKHKTKQSMKPSSKMKRKVKKKEFIGWGSRALIQFLESVNINVTEKLTQGKVSYIINEYIKENKLLHPDKKRKVLCNDRLQSLFGRKVLNKQRICHYLDAHLAENQQSSEEDDIGYDSDDKNDIFAAVKKQRKSSEYIISEEVKSNNLQYHYASIVPDNIDLVYLRRSFIQKLLEEPDTFDNKVIGSFVKYKSDPNDFIQRESHQLMQVTGTIWNLAEENNKKVQLKVSGSRKYDKIKEISINFLSDCDVTKEECEELKQCVKSGLLKQPTIVELKKKAAILHEDRLKHWIPRKLKLLQNRIDLANEKGWRREFYEYLEEKQKLERSIEQLLQNVPDVIPADLNELDYMAEDPKDEVSAKSPDVIPADLKELDYMPEDPKDEVSAKSGPVCSSDTLRRWEGDHITSGAGEEKQQVFGSEEHGNSVQKSKTNQCSPSTCQSVRVEQGTVKSVQVLDFQLDNSSGVKMRNNRNAATQTVELDKSTNDEKVDKRNAATQTEDLESPDYYYCLSSDGKKRGPYTQEFLNEWKELDSSYRTWKAGQSQEDGIPLYDAVALFSAKQG